MERGERKRGTKSKIYPLVLVGLLLLSFVSDLSALSVTVNDVECVYEYVLYEGDSVTGNFVVVDHYIFWSSDHPGIDFIVTSPAGNVVHSQKGTSGDKFDFKAPQSRMYKFCFHNPYSTPETVSFYIHVGHIPSEHDLDNALLSLREHLGPIYVINVKIDELREALVSVTAELNYLKAHDTRHRRSSYHTDYLLAMSWSSAAANESTRKRVILYTIGEYIMLALASALQVAYIRRLFTNESTRKRVILYTIREYIMLALASALQVAYIRRLFSKSVGYNRV